MIELEFADAFHANLDVVQQADLVVVDLFVHVLQQFVQPDDVLSENSQVDVVVGVQPL